MHKTGLTVPDRLRALAGRTLEWRQWPLALAALHCIIAFNEYRHGLNFHVDEGRSSWDWFWQAIPTIDLLERPWQSFWVLHAQPPGFSLWGWFWLSAGGAKHFPGTIQLGYVLLGAGVVAMTYKLALALMRGRGWALAAGLGMALNPALFYYESYLLYEPLVMFLLMASAWCLWKALAGQSGRWLAAFVVMLNALVLTRSLYHWVFLIGAMAFAWPMWRALRPRWRWAMLALAIALPGLWYAKNAAQYGFFGASSWYGMGLYKCVVKGYSYRELVELRDRGIIPRFMEQIPSFSEPPSRYRSYGFTRTSDVPLLGRNDFHNINVPEISRQFGLVAKRLILLHPWRYACAVHGSYVKFCRPPSRFQHLDFHRIKHIGWEPLISQWLYGQWLTDQIEIPTRIQFGSMFYFYFPLLMLGGAIWAGRGWKACRPGQREGMSDGEVGDKTATPEVWARPAVMAYFLYACLYVAVIGCLMENGENERFRFATEPMTLIITLILLRALCRRGVRPAAAQSRSR